ncbi:MAG: phosphatidylglycerol lysyltransferase domain-containing protein [Sporomusaceae bacterium]|nr:phosphatidylglycerol lysyltransferase domain-containing protein [Sporomusaceae bacterium]
MEFYKPRLAEYEKYVEYYKLCMQLCAETSFLALWSYEEEMELERAFYSELFWHRINWHGQRIWMPPIGEWERGDWEDILTAVVPPGTVFGFVPEFLANRWLDSFPDKIAIDVGDMRGEWDYLFHLKRQIAMEGQAFADMRNRCKSFANKYACEYSTITVEDIPAIKEFQEQWMKWNESKGKLCDDLLAENRTIIKILDNWKSLLDKRVFGAKMVLDNQIISYIITEELDDYILSGHVLKGNYNYNGVYQTMQLWVYKNQYAHFPILNMWGDGGIPGLRQSKLSLNPIGFIKKYLVTWKG